MTHSTASPNYATEKEREKEEINKELKQSQVLLDSKKMVLNQIRKLGEGQWAVPSAYDMNTLSIWISEGNQTERRYKCETFMYITVKMKLATACPSTFLSTRG